MAGYDLVTDRSKGSNNFDRERRSVLIAGKVKDAPDLILNTETQKFRYGIEFREARVITATGYEPKLVNGEAKQTYTYGKAISRNGGWVPESPRKESLWFDGVEPAFVGEDLEMKSFEGRKEWVGMDMLLVEHDVPRLNREGKTYPVRKRWNEGEGPDAHDPLNQEVDERDRPFNKDGIFEYLRDENGDVVMKDGRPTFVMEGIAMWDEAMLPLNNCVEGAVLSEAGKQALAIYSGGVESDPFRSGDVPAQTVADPGESAGDAVARIWLENGEENSAAFRRAALANPTIQNDTDLKAELTLGKYEGPAV